MWSSKSWLLGVSSSNGAIKTLFLPTLYFFFLSPFLLFIAKFYKVDQLVTASIPKDYQTPDIWPYFYGSLLAILFATRYLSGKSDGGRRRTRRVQLAPYWIPGLRHWISFVWGGEKWLKSIRDLAIADIFAYSLAGTKHNVILSPQLLQEVLQKKEFQQDAEPTTWAIPHKAFKMPKRSKTQYAKLQSATRSAFQTDEQLEQLLRQSLDILAKSLPDLITFNPSMVDQMPWERVAGLDLTDGTAEAECELFSIINEFFCNTILTSMAGPQFPESYQLLASDLSTFNQSFYALALGLPRFIPIPGLPTAAFSQKRLLDNLDRYFYELAHPPTKRVPADDDSISGEETDAETPTILTGLNEILDKHDVPLEARASITLELLHKVVSEAVPLAFWTILHTHASPSAKAGKDEQKNAELLPLERISQESRAWAKAVQPASIHPLFPSPPEITFQSAATLFSQTALPYLRSCVNETRRLYTASIDTVRVTEPLTITSEATGPGTGEEWEIDVGSCIDVGLSQTLINTSSANHLSPNEFRPERFLSSSTSTQIGTSQIEHLTTPLVMAFVAGVVQLWDIQAAPKKTLADQWREAQAVAAGQEEPAAKKTSLGVWTVPKAIDGASVKLPKGDMRVRIRRREGLPASKNGPNRR